MAPAMRNVTSETRHRLSMHWWWTEIGATILSLVSLVVLVCILVYMNDQPQDKWFKALSINAAISLLTTVAKSAMMVAVSSSISQSMWTHFKQGPRRLYDISVFDEASRSPWGSAQLMF